MYLKKKLNIKYWKKKRKKEKKSNVSILPFQDPVSVQSNR